MIVFALSIGKFFWGDWAPFSLLTILGIPTTKPRQGLRGSFRGGSKNSLNGSDETFALAISLTRAVDVHAQ
jgi:hypothetical protein